MLESVLDGVGRDKLLIGGSGESDCKRLVPFFSADGRYDIPKIEILVDRFNFINGHCSMILDNRHQLELLKTNVSKVSQANYRLGLMHRMKDGNFPKYCCGIASVNVMLSLIEHGYFSAACLFDLKKDHTYVTLPFVLNDRPGIVTVDPTSDQYGLRPNLISLEFDPKIKGPDFVLDISVLKEHMPYIKICGDVNLYKPIRSEAYLSKAFSNAIDVVSL